MYLHLGEDTVVRKRDIIGIFDIENTSISKHTKDFLARSEKGGRVVTVSYEMPKSFVVCRTVVDGAVGSPAKDEGEEKVYISQISTSTLKKRAAE